MADEGAPPADAPTPSAPPSRGGRGKGSCVCKLTAEILTEEKGFFIRYTLFNGDKVTSSPLGYPEGEPAWSPDQLEPPAGATDAATGAPSRAVKSFRLAKEHNLPVTDRLIGDVDSNPIVGVFIGRRDGGAMTARTNYLACLTLDASALFTGTSVSACVGALPWASASGKNKAAVSAMEAAFGKSATLSAGALGGAPPPLPMGGAGIGAPAIKGLSFLRVTLSTSTPILNEEMCAKYNPLALTLTSACNMPGVRVESECLQKHVANSPYVERAALSRVSRGGWFVVVIGLARPVSKNRSTGSERGAERTNAPPVASRRAAQV